MEFEPILEGIETLLKAASTTKDEIKDYYYYELPVKIVKQPFAVLGFSLETTIAQEWLSGSSTFQAEFNGMVSVALLSKAYYATERSKTVWGTLDTLQHNVCGVLRADNSLNDSVNDSTILKSHRVKVAVEGADFYFSGFEVLVGIDVHEA